MAASTFKVGTRRGGDLHGGITRGGEPTRRMNETSPVNRRILVVDDNPAIHEDFCKILMAENASASTIDQEAAQLLGGGKAISSGLVFALDSAFQGQEALVKVEQALAAR